MLSKYGRKRLLVSGLLAGLVLAAAIVAAAVTAIVSGSTQSQQAAHQQPQIAHVLGISMWSSHRANPHERSQKVDVFSVTVQNPTGSGKQYVYFDLVSTNKASENQSEPNILVSSADYELDAAWITRLSPGQKTRVLFVAQSSRYKKYCALGGKTRNDVLRRTCTT